MFLLLTGSQNYILFSIFQIIPQCITVCRTITNAYFVSVCLLSSRPSSFLTEPAKDVSRYEGNGSMSENQAKSVFSYHREPSYFEIPTKELQQRPAKKPESQVHEVPTKDTPDPTEVVSSTPTPPRGPKPRLLHH